MVQESKLSRSNKRDLDARFRSWMKKNGQTGTDVAKEPVLVTFTDVMNYKFCLDDKDKLRFCSINYLRLWPDQGSEYGGEEQPLGQLGPGFVEQLNLNPKQKSELEHWLALVHGEHTVPEYLRYSHPTCASRLEKGLRASRANPDKYVEFYADFTRSGNLPIGHALASKSRNQLMSYEKYLKKSMGEVFVMTDQMQTADEEPFSSDFADLLTKSYKVASKRYEELQKRNPKVNRMKDWVIWNCYTIPEWGTRDEYLSSDALCERVNAHVRGENAIVL